MIDYIADPSINEKHNRIMQELTLEYLPHLETNPEWFKIVKKKTKDLLLTCYKIESEPIHETDPVNVFFEKKAKEIEN